MNQRLKEVIAELKKLRKIYTQADFAKEVGIGAVQLSEIVSGKRFMSEYYVNKVLTRFPEIRKEWLENGEGDMLNLAYSSDVSPTAIADDHSTAIAGDKNVVNADKTIAMLVAEVAAQRRVTEKVLEQNSELLAIIAGKK